MFSVIAEFTEQPFDMNISRTEDLELVCTAEGFPLTSVVWLHNSTEVEENGTICINTTIELFRITVKITVKNTSLDDSGYYQCIAMSPVFPDIPSDTAYVLIQGQSVLQISLSLYGTSHRYPRAASESHSYQHHVS